MYHIPSVLSLAGYLINNSTNKKSPQTGCTKMFAATLKKLFIYRLRNTKKQDQIQSMEPLSETQHPGSSHHVTKFNVIPPSEL